MAVEKKIKKMSDPRMKIMYFLLILISSVIYPLYAHGHKVYLFAWVEGDVVYTDSYFPNKKKVIGGRIEIFDPAGNKLLEGKTDDRGSFSFKIPKRADLKIVLDATMGHRTEFILSAEEISEDTSREDTKWDDKEEAKWKIKKKVKGEYTASSNIYIDLEKMEAIFEKTLDARLKPIERKIAKLQKEKGPGFNEIIGGLGYIVGLMGIVLYFKSKKVQNKGDKPLKINRTGRNF